MGETISSLACDVTLQSPNHPDQRKICFITKRLLAMTDAHQLYTPFG
jgi:hypothetical protein